MFEYAPLNGEHLEELLVKSYIENEYEVEWKANSHSQGADFNVIGIGRHQSKSNTEDENKEQFAISGSRTTKQKTLQEKIDRWLSILKSWDVIILLSRGKSQFIFYLINPKILNPTCLKWKEIVKKNEEGEEEVVQYVTIGNCDPLVENNIAIKITKSMSDQIWFYIDHSILNDKDAMIELLKIEV